jgi:3-methyladenine DNA glycosylase/8-oxoguanine DNA glycosylase
MTTIKPPFDEVSLAKLQDLIARTLQDSTPPPPVAGGTSHVGAVLADAVLQAGMNYMGFVAPRVKRVEEEYPTAASISGLIEILTTTDAGTVLNCRNGRKCRTFSELAQLLAGEGIESTEDLRGWLQGDGARAKLLAVHGVAVKTAAYLRLLVGLESVAIDVHLRRAAADVGVHGDDEQLEALFSEAARRAGVALSKVDEALWNLGTNRVRPTSS